MMVVSFRLNGAAGRSAVDALITWWTRSEWVHCEVIVPHPQTGELWAFSARSDDKQVSARPLAQVVSDNVGWLFYQVPIALANGEPLWVWLMDQCYTPYDYRGLVHSMILGRPSRDSDQWFCSELVMAAIQRYSRLDLLPVDPAFVSPGALRTWLINEGCPKFQYVPATLAPTPV